MFGVCGFGRGEWLLFATVLAITRAAALSARALSRTRVRNAVRRAI